MTVAWWETESTFVAKNDGRNVESREYAAGAVAWASGAPGRHADDVTCPFCGAETYAYAWSRAGSGKRCSGTCGAVLGWWGAYRYVKGS